MPELPEVETIRSGLERQIVGKKITDINFLWEGILKEMPARDFKKIVIGQTVKSVNRRAKNLYIELSEGLYLLLHFKMTGHVIYTNNCWKVDAQGKWIKQGKKESPMYDRLNQYIRVIFGFDNNKILAFSDLRKFAYIKLVDKKTLDAFLSGYGPEPLSKDFTYEYLADLLSTKNIAIKKALMDPKNIAGIGNIYADEILWEAKIHPLSVPSKLTQDAIMALYKAIPDILKKSISLRGTSTSDFRDTEGKKGKFGDILKVYRRTGLPCPRDGKPIKRIVVGGRGTHFCETCQRRYPNV